jgi:alanyl aminopeptidase
MRDVTVRSERSVLLTALHTILLTLFTACAAKQELAQPAQAHVSAPQQPAQLPAGARLPTTVSPRHYRIGLTVDPELAQFAGEVSIELALEMPTDVIYLHAQKIAASRVSLVRANEEPLTGTLEQVDQGGLAAIRFAQPVEAGPARLDIAYTAPFGSGMRGLYRMEVEGKWYVFSQFEPVSARLMVPSFDEPRFKAPFDVRLKIKKGHVGIANARLLERKSLDASFDELTFATTPPLPSYLLAVAVGPLDVVDGPMLTKTALRDRDVPLRGVALSGKGSQLAHNLSLTPAMITELENYFGVAYPFDKLDLIAVPDVGGAMENAAAITFSERTLLVKPNATEIEKRRFARTGGHELAHQWFGDLVTMAWWDDLWLNEAFASWMEGVLTDKLHPEHEAPLSLLAYTHNAMGIDSRAATRQVRSPINSEQELGGAFDAITYSKGRAVLAMFEGYLGEGVFRDGLRRYIKAHAFGSATGDDLIAALSEAASRPLKDAFSSFLDQPGVPVVSAELQCEDGAASLKLAQTRYVPLATQIDPGARWHIPICIRFATQEGSRAQCTLLTTDQTELKLETDGCPRWVMPNADAAGYYRWSLAEDAVLGLVDVAATELSAAEQLSLLENVNAALRAGTMNANTALAAFEKLAMIDKRPVLESSLGKLAFMRDALLDEASLPAYRELVRGVVEGRYQKLGIRPAKGERDDSELKLARSQLVTVMARTVRDQGVRKELAAHGRALLGLEKHGRVAELPSELVELALSVAIQDGGQPAFERALAEFAKSSDQSMQSNLLRALSSTHDPALATRVLDLALGEQLRGSQLVTPLLVQAAAPETRALAWRWTAQHLDAMQTKIGDEVLFFIPYIFAELCSDEAAADVEALLAPRAERVAGASRELNGLLEAVRSCSTLREQQAGNARDFFSQFSTGKPRLRSKALTSGSRPRNWR